MEFAQTTDTKADTNDLDTIISLRPWIEDVRLLIDKLYDSDGIPMIRFTEFTKQSLSLVLAFYTQKKLLSITAEDQIDRQQMIIDMAASH